MNVRIKVSAKVYPTEDEEKVKKAILNIFPDVVFEKNEDVLSGVGNDISIFREKLALQKIRDSARMHLKGCVVGNKIMFKINKQVAFVGIVSFSDGESAAGDINVEIECNDINDLIDHIAPSTAHKDASITAVEEETWEEE